MKRILLTLALFIFAIQVSYQQIDFKPQRTTTVPFGVASGTNFDLNRGSDSFNMLPKKYDSKPWNSRNYLNLNHLLPTGRASYRNWRNSNIDFKEGF